MKVRIGAIEIIDPSWEELEHLIERYGGYVEHESETIINDSVDSSRQVGRKNGGASPGDRVVLEQLIQSGTSGIPTQSLGEILGKRGKSIRPGLMEWASRIGLTPERNIDPFQEVRVGSRRGARLKESYLQVAKELLRGL